jgi:hypothetical protein
MLQVHSLSTSSASSCLEFLILVDEDSLTTSAFQGERNLMMTPRSSAQNLAKQAVSAELKNFSEGPQCAPRCSRLRRHSCDYPVGDPKAKTVVLNALSGVLFESIFGAVLSKGNLQMNNSMKERMMHHPYKCSEKCPVLK